MLLKVGEARGYPSHWSGSDSDPADYLESLLATVALLHLTLFAKDYWSFVIDLKDLNNTSVLII